MVKINNNKKFKIFVLVGEESGDIIAADFIKELKKLDKNISFEFFGITGFRMKNLGVTSIFDYKKINYLGFLDVILNYIPLKLRLNRLVKDVIYESPDLIITIDAKLFSLSFAKKIISSKKNKFLPKLIHIVPPTIWAHSPSRAKSWKNVFDLIISIIPNEDIYFKKFGIKTKYLGNPIFDNFIKKIKHLNLDKNLKNNYCLILPGSRKKEIQNNLKILLQVVKTINQKYNIKWILPITDTFKDLIFDEINSYKLHKCIDIVNFDKSMHKIINSKVAIACSGTVTLQLALAAIPTISIYKTSFINAIFAKYFVNFDNVILPNFITGKRIVPLLFQKDFNVNQLIKIFNEYYDNNLSYKRKFLAFSKELKVIMSKNKKGFNHNLTREIINLLN